MPNLQFPDAAHLALPTYTNAGNGKPIPPDAGPMHAIAMRAVFTQQCNWYSTFAAVKESQLDRSSQSLVVAFGPDKCVPPTLIRALVDMSKLVHSAESTHRHHDTALQPFLVRAKTTNDKQQQRHERHTVAENENAIAVVGMAIKVAGADNLDEFSRMLRSGTSQHERTQPERMRFDSLFRDDDQRDYFANFMHDIDAFDHKFFNRSPRESASMDPQQRLLLQTAYQAVEQSGYFTELARSGPRSNDKQPREHVGVYMGAPAVDYEHNVACHPANALTATGNLRSFLSGRVAHQFGWTGPAMAIDTACSSSAVAIHLACRDLLTGECSAALAGGVALFTNPIWFQNLAAANFLSPTGQCKPFDSAADGFCRAEGIACVFLKRKADAVADGNQILGSIASSAVYQNQNCTPLFVPNTPSLSQLLEDVIARSKISPEDISLVEAHGTGTPVGDPAEYESIRRVLGGQYVARSKLLPIGSVKGHVGHTEGASGVVSLIKVLLMMHDNYIPPQASFSRLSPAIKSSPADKLEVVTSLRRWSEEDDPMHGKAAIINNYGAGGSNAALVVTEQHQSPPERNNAYIQLQGRFPFRITGLDARSVRAYASKLNSLVRSKFKEAAALSDWSFNINRQSNPTLGHGLIFNCNSVSELSDILSTASSSSSNATELDIKPIPTERPVILCFGGQVSKSVGLDRGLYNSIDVLRHHLDECDAVMQSEELGLSSIYPGIFSRTPEQDPVRLQATLFAMQYACARSWIDCGLSDGKIVAVVGHSFGELTALCISEVLSLKDAIHLVVRRAQLIRDARGSDNGAMMAVDAPDESIVQELLAEATRLLYDSAPASIACYNGPRSFTLAGSVKAIDAVIKTIEAADNSNKFSAISCKKLNVTNAFHSSLVNPLLGSLENIGSTLEFHDPLIPVEHATETKLSVGLTAKFVADHLRKPVYFNHAVQRLAKKYPSAIFLEAGSSSTITTMAMRALGSTSSYHFQALNITNDNGLGGLTDATLSLWKQGLSVSFWAHHARQTNEYTQLLLPPYQFEKTRHWLELKSPIEVAAAKVASQTQAKQPHQQDEQDEKNLGLWTFSGYLDGRKRGSRPPHQNRPRFRINTGSEKYKMFVSGHVIAQTAPICPGTLQIDMAIEALFSLHPDWRRDGNGNSFEPVVLDMTNHSPLCIDSSRDVWLDFTSLDSELTLWEWEISSASSGNNPSQTQIHVQGKLHIRSSADAKFISEWARYERLASHASCASLLAAAAGGTENRDDTDVLQGRNVYRAFSEFVDYSGIYRGVRAVVSRGDECAGRVHRGYTGDTWLDVLLDDCFSQVSGICVNYCMTDAGSDDMYVANGCELMMRSPRGVIQAKQKENPQQNIWHVYARNSRQSDTAFVTDVFVFDAASGQLAEVMLGIQYTRTSKAAMSRMLSILTRDKSLLKNTPAPLHSQPTTGTDYAAPDSQSSLQLETGLTSNFKRKKTKTRKHESAGIADEVKALVANVSGVGVGEITLDTALADIGIDSLMGMELRREIDTTFKCSVGQGELLQATNVRQLMELISTVASSTVKGDAANIAALSESEDNENDHFDSSSSSIQRYDGTSASSASISTSSSAMDRITPGDGKSLLQEGDEEGGLQLSEPDILDCFGAVKMDTDRQLCELHLDNIDRIIFAATSRLSVALIVEAFEQLNCSLRSATPGETLQRVRYLDQYERLIQWVYSFLEDEAHLIDKDAASGLPRRTAVAIPPTSSESIMKELLEAYPDWAVATKLIYHAGKSLARVLSGETDGIQVLFGSAEGHDLVAGLYRDHPFNIMLAGQMCDLIGRLAKKAAGTSRTLKILEMGAGTGGTTCVLIPFLASLGISVEYTFTDLSSSLVAAARRTYAKKYPFMRFAVHDIEKPPTDELCGQQHIVIASNAVHATHNLLESAINIRKVLRPDGFLMLLEQTECMPFSNLVFGLLEGWWLFDDGRIHAIVSAEHWERDLHAAGFGHVDWTDGQLSENSLQRVIIALASQGPVIERLSIPTSRPSQLEQAIITPDIAAARELRAEKYVNEYTNGWASSFPSQYSSAAKIKGETENWHDAVVVVTGATGSLGSHLVAAFAEKPNVKMVVCLNRPSSMTAEARQEDAFSRRGISLSPKERTKLRVFEVDSFRPQLGLAASEYAWLAQNGTHIVHNAWPMSGTRSIAAFEPQFQTMRNLLDLARDMGCSHRANGSSARRIGFQLVTSIGVVGNHAAIQQHQQQTHVVSEDRVPLAAVLPTGYCEAKWVCERMLDETLHQHPSLFRTMVVRPGQIAGSSTSGAWNSVEHFAFIVKSAQSLRAWPDFDGRLQWIPVDQAAASMVDLLYIGDEASAPPASPVYHIDNPVDQPWKEMSPVLANALGIPLNRIEPFRNWLRRVCRVPLQETDNPAGRIFDFLDQHFERMSCGGLILDTTKAQKHSKTMAALGPVSLEVARRYVEAWKESGYLKLI
ncbi:hypothetical protein AJ79_03379 [Helicocarpus griseus UAMH5409]|uniref:Non-reducing polyketide synthase nscA n=1 Tax=Helicocarpus griseus UAMH5409 TaxID=1447875 RepID=A0A2B7XYF6_9EURO|nr:hypothetical protein AJ79_03379 [Helicocarpus griseus UAMH5409]